MPSKDLLDELLRQVLTAKKDATLKIELSKNHEIRRYKDEIYIIQKIKMNKKNMKSFGTVNRKLIYPMDQN